MFKQVTCRRVKATLCLLTAFSIVNLIAACSGSPSESDIVAACLKEGETVAQIRRDKQMGVNRDAFCKCAAKEAKTTLTPDGQRATILFMQGKKEESRAITAKMSQTEQENHLKNGLIVAKKCMG